MTAINTIIRSFGLVAGLFLYSALTHAAPNELSFIETVQHSGESAQIKLVFKGKAPDPAVFTSQAPARLNIDLQNTSNKLPWKQSLNVNKKPFKKITTIEAGGRTRVIVNLDKLLTHKITSKGNSITISLGPQPNTKAPPPAPKSQFSQETLDAFLGIKKEKKTSKDTEKPALKDVIATPQPGNKLQLKFIFTAPPEKPGSFTIDKPARIAIDLPGTANQLKWKNKNISLGVAKNIQAIETNKRMRVIINLEKMVKYDTKNQGNNFILTLDQSMTDEEPPAALLGTDAFSIKKIDFRRGKEGQGKIIITLSSPSIPVDIREESGKLTLRFPNTRLIKALEQRLDVVDFATPVSLIDSFNEGEDARLIIKNKGNYEHLAYQTDDKLIIEVKKASDKAMTISDSTSSFRGEKLSLNFQDIEIRAVLQLLADFTGFNLVTSDEVDGRLSLRLKNVPWDQALDIILKTKGLGMRKIGNIIMVAPSEDISAHEKVELETLKQRAELVPLSTELITINYAKAVDIAALLKNEITSQLTERGSTSVDERTNTLIISDIEEKIHEIKALVAHLDVPVRQVMIEARIVIANNNFAKELGARFGVTDVASSGGTQTFTSGSMNATNSMTQSYVTNLGGTNPGTVDIPFGNYGDRLNVNMPVSPLSYPGQFAVGILQGGTLLDLELSALQTEGHGEIVSNPRVITADKKEAVIEQGTEIPYLEASGSGSTSVSFRKAVLSLKVTPHITPDDKVILDLIVSKDQVGTVFNGVPSIDTKEVDTQVLIDNGETVVLGGIYEQTQAEEQYKVPFLGDIPFIGALFRYRRSVDEKTELLIFVTPKIVKGELGTN